MLDVLALLAARRPPPATRAAGRIALAAATPAEECPEEVGKRILVAEEVLHLLGAHGPVAAAGAAAVDVPGLVVSGAAAEAERLAARKAVALLLGLFVLPPVR